MSTMKPVIGLSCSTSTDPGARPVRRYSCPEPYVRRVEEAGGIPILLPTADPARVPLLLALVHGVVLIGGDDVDPSIYGAAPHPKLGDVDPARDAFEIAIARRAAADALPAFGICRGCQVMNVALGGTLVQHIPGEIEGALPHAGRYDAAHDVAVTPGTRLHRLLGKTRVAVNSHHHQSIGAPADGFDVTARTSDGVVEAAELPGHAFFLGVQWHPERMPDAEATRRLFRAFLEAAVARARSVEGSPRRTRASKARPASRRRVRG